MKGFIKILKNSYFLKKNHIFAFLFCISMYIQDNICYGLQSFKEKNNNE